MSIRKYFVLFTIMITLTSNQLFAANPIITDTNADIADPEILIYDGKFYLYPTYIQLGKMSKYFRCWSSTNLQDWTDEGQIFHANNTTWGKSQCWAPTIAERNGIFYFYFCLNYNIGIATAAAPTGPFTDAKGSSLVRGNIDPDIFIDTDGQAYLYYGQTFPKVRKLNEDMVSFSSSETVISGAIDFREAAEVFKRNGIYYMMWSENDTRDTTYEVAYGTMPTPLGPISKKDVILKSSGTILGPGHNSVINIPGTDDWYILYHRHHIPGKGSQWNEMWREVCIDRMYFNADGTIKTIIPALKK